MASFFPALEKLKTVLEDGLRDFCTERWGKLPKVSIAYKKRAEITLDEFPLILITRPNKNNDPELVSVAQGEHTVLLYCGFCEHDRERAAEDSILFEEAIDTLIHDNFDLDGLVESIEPVNLANDEGNFHPVYFQVAELKAIHQTS